jgi:hypothetical protein
MRPFVAPQTTLAMNMGGLLMAAVVGMGEMLWGSR